MRWFWLLVLVGVSVGAWLVLRPAEDRPPEVGGLESSEREVDPVQPSLVGQAPTGAPASLTTGRYPFEGRVVDESGAGLADIPLDLTLQQRAGSGASHVGMLARAWILQAQDLERKRVGGLPIEEVVGTLVSESDGHFAGTVDVAGSYRVRARVEPPLVGGAATIYLGQSPSLTRPATVVVSRSSPLHGRVEDHRGQPLQGIVSASTKAWREVVPTTEAGEFVFAGVPAGDLQIGVRVPGRVYRLLTVTAPVEAPVIVVVPSGDGVLEGKITTEDGQAVAGALLSVYWELDGDARLETVAVTANDGTYEISGIPPGRVSTFSAGADGFMPAAGAPGRAKKPTLVVSGDERLRLDIQLGRGATLEGYVTWQESGQPIKGARVEMFGFNSFLEPTFAMTDADGAYRLEMLTVGKGVILASYDGGFDPSLEPALANARVARFDDVSTAHRVQIQAPGEALRRDLVLARGVAVRGRVVDAAEQPVAGAGIEVQRHGTSGSLSALGMAFRPDGTSARSLADGSFEVRGLGPRLDHVLTATVQGGVGVPSALVDTTQGDVEGVILRVVAGARLDVQVLDTAGRPAPSAGITLYGMPSGYRGPLGLRSDAEGRFTLDALPPGSYEIGGSHDGAKGRLVVADLALGEHRTELVLQLAAPRVVAGHVLGADGRAVAGLALRMQSSMRPGVLLRTTTDEEGAFRFEAEHEGVAEILTRDGQVLARVTPPAHDVEIRHEPPRTWHLRGTVQMVDGSVVTRASLRVYYGDDGTSDGFTVRDGVFDLEVRAAGAMRIHVERARKQEGPIGFIPAWIQVEDVDQPLEIRLDVGDSVEGRVIDSAGAAVPDVEISVNGERLTQSGPDGSWRVGGLGADAVLVSWAPPPPFAPPTPRLVRAGDGPLEIVLAAGATLRGRVVVAGGAPPEPTMVSASWGAQGRVAGGKAYIRAEPGGAFAFRALPPGIRVDVRAAVLGSRAAELGYAGAWVRGLPSDATDVEVPLVLQAAIEGTTVDKSGKPLGGVHIFPVELLPGVLPPAPSDDQGHFHIHGLLPGAQSFYIRREGVQHLVTIELQAPAAGVRVVLDDLGTIAGRVTGGDVLEGASIACLDDARDGRARALLMGRCEADGTFKLEGLPVGRSWTLLAMSATEARCARVEGVATGSSGVEIPLLHGHAIEGRVTWEGQPVRHAQVRFTSASWIGTAFTASDGTFRSPGLPAGTYDVTAHERMTYFATHTQEGVSAGTRGLVIELAPGAR